MFVFDCQPTFDRSSKRYAVDVAEGVRIWNPRAGVDAVRFASCRVEKLKSGPITFGGLNVLILKDLVLNLPLPAETGGDEKASDGKEDSRRAARSLGLSDTVLSMAGVRGKTFSGLRIDGLTIGRIANKTSVPVFSAVSCRNKGRQLQLEGCCVYQGGVSNSVGKAVLTLKPSAKLIWQSGEMSLGDLFGSCKGRKESE